MLAFQLLFLCLLGLAVGQENSAWASAASSVAASIRNSLSVQASMAATGSLSAVIMISYNTSVPKTASSSFLTTTATATATTTSTATTSTITSGNLTALRSGLRYPMTATANISTPLMYTSFIVQASAGADRQDVQYAAMFGSGAVAAAILNLLG